MAGKLRPWQERFYQHIRGKTEGETVGATELMAATEWSPVTLKTHLNKNALAPFLALVNSSRRIEDARFRMVRDGASITREDVSKAFTQIRPATLTLSAGLRFKGLDDDYELISEIGRGAVAQVWRCRRIRASLELALKVVDPRADLLDPSTLANVKSRFSREARNGTKLAHPNVVRYVDTGRYQEHDFLVMELGQESLALEISRAPLAVDRASAVVRDCAQGLAYLHKEGCVHRDVKPHNILRFSDRYVLGDLGIVKWSDMNTAFTSAGTLTRASVQLGSWLYMAPEQRVAPHEATPASDVYALGISWYEMLTGRTLDPSFVAAKAFVDGCSDNATNQLIRQMIEFDQAKRPTPEDILRKVDDR